MPEDFTLGPLQLLVPASGSEEAAPLAVAKAFMDGLAGGKLDENLLLPEAREALAVLLAPAGKAGEPKAATETAVNSDAAGGKKSEGEAPAPPPGSADLRYRLGAITITGDDASLSLRMPREKGSSPLVEGLLSLHRAEGKWYVQALALKPPMAEAPGFVPGSRD